MEPIHLDLSHSELQLGAETGCYCGLKKSELGSTSWTRPKLEIRASNRYFIPHPTQGKTKTKKQEGKGTDAKN
ncbi:hypothetical protein GBA52_003657 [Prunus armeniaca]|nr:hypothetical protein GBA52_003657 [Prunus armeniaca]